MFTPNSSKHLNSQQTNIISNKQFSTQEKSQDDASKYIKDYELNESTLTNKKRITLTDEEVRQKHPFEYVVHKQRAQQDAFANLQPNQLIAVNISPDTTAAQLKSIFSPNKERLLSCKLIHDRQNKPAYCFVTYYTSKEAMAVKKKLKNYWIGYHLLKIRSHEDKDEEHFDNRTMVVRNIPYDMTQEQIYTFFSEQGGQILNIELPTEDVYMKEQLLQDNPGDEYQRERQQQQDRDFILAKRIIKDADRLESRIAREEEAAQNGINLNDIGEQHDNIDPAKELQDELTAYNYNQKKMASKILKQNSHLMNTVMRLQSEKVEVEKSQDKLKEHKNQLETELRNPMGYSEIPLGLQQQNDNIESDAKQDEIMKERSEVLSKVLKYLKQNPDAVDEQLQEYLNLPDIQKLSSQQDALSQIQFISKKELALVYDYILQSLEERIDLIKTRIQKSTEHFGIDERIIYQVKDYEKELESIPDANLFDNSDDESLKVEDVLSVNEQINAVRQYKDATPEQRFYQIVSQEYNPFEPPNFSSTAIDASANPKLDTQRIFWMPSKNMPHSMARMFAENPEWREEFKEQYDQLLEELKGKIDIPFDELYHKEKMLIRNVVLAQQALTDQNSVPNPLSDRMFSPEQANKDGQISDSDYEMEHPYFKEQRELSIATDQTNKNEITNDDYKFKIGESGELKDMVKKGLMSQKEYNEMKSQIQQNKYMNKGYVFITFTHADDARKALIYYSQEEYQGLKLLVSTKKGIDHQDLDVLYRFNQIKNDSKLVDEMDGLAQAKKELQTFEDKIDEDLPSFKRLRQFQQNARSALENDQKSDRSNPAFKRTKVEEEALNQKIKKLEKENAKLDYTELFDTKRAEDSRKMQHKKAFASYKAFEFLKAGVKPAKGTESLKPLSAIKTSKYEAYKFPPLEQTVAKFLTKDDMPRVLDRGERYTKPGRKYEYNEQDFMEMYYGKDLARVPSQNLEEDGSVFGYNESLKKKYPIDKYMKYPAIGKALEKISEQYTPQADQSLEHYLNQIDEDNIQYHQDEPYPLDKKKTKAQVVEERTQALLDRYPDGQIDGKDIAMVEKSIKRDFKDKLKFDPTYGNNLNNQIIKNGKREFASKNTKKDYKSNNKSVQEQFLDTVNKLAGKQDPTYEEQGEIQIKNTADYGSKIQEEMSDVNKDYIYKMKHVQKMGYEKEFESRSTHYKKLKDQAGGDTNKLNELMDNLKDQKHIATHDKLGGDYYERVKYGQDEGTKTVRDVNIQGQQNLKQYAGYNDGDKSEREDEDIYSYYKNKMNQYEQEESEWQQKKEQIKDEEVEDHWKNKIDQLKGQIKEAPGFKEYYDAKQKGQHPFESDEYTKHNKEEKSEEQKQRQLEEKQTAEIYTRELLGRMYGEKITARQFEMLTSMKITPEQALAHQKDHNYGQFLDNKAILSLSAESKESTRRKNVIEGKWTEEESYKKIQEYEQYLLSKIPSPREQSLIAEHYDDWLIAMKNIKNPEALMEREYHFDEGMGKSVDQHVEELKKDIPNIQVEMRRDRDGYAIIKTSMKQTFKYDLDQIMNYDQDKQLNNIKRGLNELMKQILPYKNVNGVIEVDRELLEEGLQVMQSQKQRQGSERYDMTEESKQRLTKLIKDNILGYLTPEQFAQQYIEFANTVEYDKTKVLPAVNMFRNQFDQEQAINDHMEDQDVMTKELYYQLIMRVRNHINLKERTPNDFIKPKKSEIQLFQQVTTSLEHGAQKLERQIDGQQEDSEKGMDKETYKKIRDEIRRRRDAKERMLRQGYPELKPYLHI